MNRPLAASRSIRRHPSGLYHRLVYFWASALLPLTMLLGGGTARGLNADHLLQILSLPLLLITLLRIVELGGFSQWRVPLLFTGAILLLPIVQLLPLPPQLWTAMPGRAIVVSTLAVAEMDIGWRPLSLSPYATLSAFLALLPAASLFLAAMTFDTAERYRLLRGPMAVVVLSVLLGFAQQVAGNRQILTPFGFAHFGYAIGFFANRNHFAALLYSMLPLAVAWTLNAADHQSRRRALNLSLGGLVIVLVLMGLSIAVSRAGVTLGVIAGIVSLVLFWQSRPASRIGRWGVIASGTALLSVVILLQLGLVDLLLQRSTEDLGRQIMTRVTTRALRQFWILGSGFGTFVPVYMLFEAADEIAPPYANHAHNDWLEVTLEGGGLSVLLASLFVLWLIWRIWAAWRPEANPAIRPRLLLARASSAVVVLLLIHSAVDYPLRTTGLMSLFAVCCALLIDTRHHSRLAGWP